MLIRAYRSIAVIVSAAALACAPTPSGQSSSPARQRAYSSGRLTTPIKPGGHGGPRGLTSLGLGAPRDGELWVPERYSDARPTPLLVMLHGAGGSGHRALQLVLPFADSAGFIVVAPDSREATWDFIRGPFGDDIARLDATLQRVSERYNIDPARVAVAGFSDGASYALSLGQYNGDMFQRIVAFSPGLATAFDRRGRPKIWVSHGRGDPILPIDRTSRRIVPALEGAGYEVTYREFDGVHAVPPEIAREAIHWLAGSV